MSAVARYLLLVLGSLACAVVPARAEDFERGKSGPAIFAADCTGCHRSAQGLAYGMSSPQLMDLLRQHYTTGPGPANQVAGYLLSVVGNGRRPKEKPLTEPQSTAGAAGEQGKRRSRSEEASTDSGGPRPPAEIKDKEAAGGEEGSAGNERDRAGSVAKRRQQAAPAEPPLPNRSKKLGQPTAATRGAEPEPARPPEPVPAQPPETVAARPPEPAEVRQSPASESKPAETAPRAAGAKAETAVEPGAQSAVPSEGQRPAPRRKVDDQPAFSAPSP